jgi:methanogenic corrinoid protein MtbC1
MVTDFFEMEGWDSHYLGASMPNQEILAFLDETPCDVLGISATLKEHVVEVKKLIEMCKNRYGEKVKVMVGGRAFLMDPQAYEAVGADAFARDARMAIDKAEELLAKS